MSQLSSLNQTQPLTTTTTSSAVQIKVNSISTASVIITDQLIGNFKLEGHGQSVTQQLTLAQSNLLNQKALIALELKNAQQRHPLIFLQTQQKAATIKLPEQLLSTLKEWLKQDVDQKSKLPNSLILYLSSELKISDKSLQSKLLNLTLQNNLLQLTFLQGEPILELSIKHSKAEETQQQLEQLIQFMLPIEQDESSVLLQYKQPEIKDTQLEDDGTLKFRLNFHLTTLGKLEIAVKLKEFSLTTLCTCNTPALQRKVQRYWPQLEQRLKCLGFTTKFQIQQKNKMEKIPEAQTSLLNIKV